MISNLKILYRIFGISGIVRAFGIRILAPQARCYQHATFFFEKKVGLEIGGPSSFFRKGGFFPIYPLIERLDNCNFDSATLWAGQIQEGLTFRYDDGKACGYQYILEATDLSQIESDRYDFILSCHSLEHIANPLMALQEWKRVLQLEGVFLLILPDGRFTFDHRRPVSTWSHIVSDYENSTGEDDLTHLPEVLKLHDLGLDPGSLDFESFRQRSEQNSSIRALHHHVFDASLLTELMDYFKMKVLWIDHLFPNHILMIAQKTPGMENALGHPPVRMNENY